MWNIKNNGMQSLEYYKNIRLWSKNKWRKLNNFLHSLHIDGIVRTNTSRWNNIQKI